MTDHDKHLSYSNIIAVGATGLIYAFNNDHVLKRCPESSDPFIHQAFSIELRASKPLGKASGLIIGQHSKLEVRVNWT